MTACIGTSHTRACLLLSDASASTNQVLCATATQLSPCYWFAATLFFVQQFSYSVLSVCSSSDLPGFSHVTNLWCRCANNGSLTAGSAVTSFHHTIVSNETDLMAAVAQQPVSVAIYSSLASFTTYASGIYNDDGCHDVTAEQLDHAVLLVGYGTEKGKDYWIVKK